MKKYIIGLLLLAFAVPSWAENFSLKCVQQRSTNSSFYMVWDFQRDDMQVGQTIYTQEKTNKMMPSTIWLWADDRIVFGQNESPASAIADSFNEIPNIRGAVFLPNQMQILDWSIVGDHPLLNPHVSIQDCKLIPKL